jgi:NAD(P)-dependent dehydrogenase (short-subunit alcohol dehydrogenase family)
MQSPAQQESAMNLTGRKGIVTGPAKGMGAAVTLALAGAGADLVLAGRDTAAIEPVADQVRALGRTAIVVRCDVVNEADVAAAAAAALDAFAGRIDLLVNVAGGSGTLGKPFWDNTLDEFEDINRLNVTGCFLTMRAVMPAMIRQRYGKIVNVGGTFGLRGRAGRAAYSTSKWGLRGLTKSAALEAGPHNININCVCPGMVEGERFSRVGASMPTGWASRPTQHGTAWPPSMRCTASARPRTSPTRCCSWPATGPARSPGRTWRSMAAG